MSLNWTEKSSERKTESDVSDNRVEFLHRNEMLLSLLSICHSSFFQKLLPPANEVCEGYVFTPVCQSLFSGGVSAQCMLGYPPGPEADTPQTRGRHPSPPRADTPWEQNLSKQPPPNRPPLRSACWEIRATSGRYASYLNAYLLAINLTANTVMCLQN